MLSACRTLGSTHLQAEQIGASASENDDELSFDPVWDRQVVPRNSIPTWRGRLKPHRYYFVLKSPRPA